MLPFGVPTPGTLDESHDHWIGVSTKGGESRYVCHRPDAVLRILAPDPSNVSGRPVCQSRGGLTSCWWTSMLLLLLFNQLDGSLGPGVVSELMALPIPLCHVSASLLLLYIYIFF